MKTKLLLLAILATSFCSRTLGQQSPAHFPLLGGTGGLTNYTIPNINSRLMAILDGISTTNDGYGGIFIYNTNDTTAVNSTNVFAPGTGQGGRWQRLLIPGAGGSAPFGAVGGGLSGTLPNPNVNLSAGTYIIGDLPLSNIVQIADNSLLGNFTGGVADPQVLTSISSGNLITIVSDETGTGKLVFNTDPRFTNTITVVGAITNTALTATRFTFAGAGKDLTDDADATFSGDTATFTKISSTAITNTSLTASKVIFTDSGKAQTSTGTVGVDQGGTAAATFTKGILVSPGGTTAFTTVAGTDGRFPYWSSSYPTTTSPLYTDGTNVAVNSTLSGVLGKFVIGGINGNNDTDQNDMRFLDGNGNALVRFLSRRGANGNQGAFYLQVGNADATAIYVDPSGNTGFGTSSGAAKVSINGGLHVGGDSNPGDNNATIDGLTTTATLLVTSTSEFQAGAVFSYVDADRVAIFSGEVLTSSDITVTELNFLDGVTASLATRVSAPIEGTGNPIADNTPGLAGQLYININTGDKWVSRGGTGSSWIP